MSCQLEIECSVHKNLLFSQTYKRLLFFVHLFVFIKFYLCLCVYIFRTCVMWKKIRCPFSNVIATDSLVKWVLFVQKNYMNQSILKEYEMFYSPQTDTILLLEVFLKHQRRNHDLIPESGDSHFSIKFLFKYDFLNFCKKKHETLL